MKWREKCALILAQFNSEFFGIILPILCQSKTVLSILVRIYAAIFESPKRLNDELFFTFSAFYETFLSDPLKFKIGGFGIPITDIMQNGKLSNLLASDVEFPLGSGLSSVFSLFTITFFSKLYNSNSRHIYLYLIYYPHIIYLHFLTFLNFF